MMIQFVVFKDVPKVLPKCKCGGKIDFFGFFSNHDLRDDKANGYCQDCLTFNSFPKEDVYGKIDLINKKDMKALLGNGKANNKDK